MSAEHRCRVCGEPLVRERTPATEGTSDPVTARLGPFEALACPSGHGRRYPYPDFGNDLRVRTYAALPTPRRRLFGGDRCRLCGGPLAGAAAEAGHFPLALELQQGVRADVAIDMPAVRCASCRALQVVLGGDLASTLLDAYAAAFEQLGLEPL